MSASPPEEPRHRAEPGRHPNAHHEALEKEFEPFGERAGMFVRSVITLAEFPGDLSNYVAEPTVRIVRGAFGKWSLDLLATLASHRHSSFGELRRLLPKISARVLSAKLKMLEEAGMVTRTVVPARPPRPEYALTERAQALVRTATKVLAYARATGAPARPVLPPPSSPVDLLPPDAPLDSGSEAGPDPGR